MAVFLILIGLLISTVEGQVLRLYSDDFLISDGTETQEACNHQYGFLPCAENAAGYVFLIVVYQVLLMIGDMLIGSASEVLFYIIGPKYGGIPFGILRALPSMTLMILTGIFGKEEDAQSQVSVGVGVYAGTTVFSLTIQWIMCMLSSSRPLKGERERETSESTKEKLRILIDGGVKVDNDTSKTAGIMLLSLIPYVVLQLVYVFTTSSGKRVMTLIALIVSSLSLISFFAYQILEPWMQRRSLKRINNEILNRLDKDRDERMSEEEFFIGFEQQLLRKGVPSDSNTQTEAVITQDEEPNIEGDLYFNKDASINISELQQLISSTFQAKADDVFFKGYAKKEAAVPSKKILFKSVLQVLIGLAMLTFLGGPLMTNILELSNAMNFPSFIISFVVVPLAVNARAAIAAIMPASKDAEKTAAIMAANRKTSKIASLSFSEIYGGVIMNNMTGLTTLLAIVYAKDLTWDFSVEVMTILVVCGVTGFKAFWSTTYHLWACIPVFLLYPISLGLFYFFQVFLGWN